MFKQISEYFDSFFFKYFQETVSGNGLVLKHCHCLAAMLEKWKSAIENKKSFGALLTDISTAFYCLVCGLLIAKLNAYEFSMKSLRLIQNYLANRK